MKTYIERAAVMESILGLTIVDTAVAQYADAVYYNLQRLPAADVVEVRHGRWIEDERTYPGPGLKNNLCSVCGEIAGAWKEGLAPERKWAYCPACGALMDGGGGNPHLPRRRVRDSGG